MKALAYGLILLGWGVLWLLRDADPWLKLMASTLLLLFLVKAAALVWQWSDGVRPKSKLGLLAFVLAWPGVSFAGFEWRLSAPAPETGRYFLESWLTMLAGCAALLAAAYFGQGQSLAYNYLALIALLLIVHMGLVEVFTDGLRLLGFTPRSLFHRPFGATSLRDFWSNRWNRAFVDMNKLFIVAPLRGRLGSGALVFLVFLLSGVLHELAISYPAGGPWGLPLSYFAFQGLGVLAERRWRWPRIVVIAWVLLPLPILFPPSFVNLFMGGICAWIYAFLFMRPLTEVLHYAFLVGAALHALVLCASVQVPGQLGWREELQRLRSLNRKVFWTYGAYIFTIIIFMGLVSWHLAEVARLNVSDWIWIAFIALFWWARIGIDFLYMKHEDWPQGPLFTVGHVCLSTLFITLTVLYSGLAVVVAGRL